MSTLPVKPMIASGIESKPPSSKWRRRRTVARQAMLMYPTTDEEGCDKAP